MVLHPGLPDYETNRQASQARAGTNEAGVVFLDLRKTTHFEVEEEVVYAVAAGHRHRTTWTSLAEVESAFPSAGLLRIQRHLLLRPEAVLGLKPLEGGRVSVRVAEGQDLEVSRSATPRLKEMLGL